MEEPTTFTIAAEAAFRILGVTQCAQRVIGFSGLGDGQNECIGVRLGQPAKFVAADDREEPIGIPGKQILARQADVIGRPRSDEVRPLFGINGLGQAAEFLAVEVQGILDGPGLLINLFEHVVRVAPAFGHLGVPLNLHDALSDGPAREEVLDGEAVPGHHSHLSVVQKRWRAW